MVLAEIVPVLALAPLAGTLVDRLSRVAAMVGLDLWRATLAGALLLVGDTVAAVYAIAFGLSVGAVLFNPAANSALPALVRGEDLVAASSGTWTAAVLSQIALVPLAGILYAALGPGPAFGINAASFVLSAALLAGLRLPAAPRRAEPRAERRAERRGFFADAATGIRLLLGDRTPEHARGRVFVAFDVFWQLGRLVSLLVGGLLAAAIGIRAVYYLGGALLVLAAVIGWTAMRGVGPTAQARQ